MQHLHQTILAKLDIDVILKLDRAVLMTLTQNDKAVLKIINNAIQNDNNCLEKYLRELTIGCITHLLDVHGGLHDQLALTAPYIHADLGLGLLTGGLSIQGHLLTETKTTDLSEKPKLLDIL